MAIFTELVIKMTYIIFANVKRTGKCPSIVNWTPTPNFWLWINKHQTLNWTLLDTSHLKAWTIPKLRRLAYAVSAASARGYLPFWIGYCSLQKIIQYCLIIWRGDITNLLILIFYWEKKTILACQYQIKNLISQILC